MSEHGPFDRRDAPGPARDKSTQIIFIGMGIVGLVLFFIVVSPFSIFGGGGGNKNASLPGGTGSSGGSAISGASVDGRAPKVPAGYEALSSLLNDIKKPKDQGPYALTVSLLQPVTDGRNLGLYTYANGKWQRLATATLVQNGTAASGQVDEIPANVAVLRLTASAVQISGWLPTGAQPDPDALGVLSTINPVDFAPSPDGSIAGNATQLPQGATGNVVRTVRSASPDQDTAVNNILASPDLRDAHITALVQLALQPGNAGVEIDYPRVNPARKADFTSFISVLADHLHQANRTLSVSLPTPVRNGVTWDTGAYDWQELATRTDTLKLAVEQDPSQYYKRMGEVLDYLKGKVDLKKVSLVVTRSSYEKASDGLRAMTLNDGLSLASEIELRTASQITPNSSVVIVGKNIFQDDGASGLRWDDQADAVSFQYPGRGGQRTVWLENSLSLAFRLDLAHRYGLGGIAIDDVSSNPALPAFWEPLRTFADSGTVNLVQPNGVLLRPTWSVQAGNPQPENKGNLVWTAPTQPGTYDIELIVSDGVIRAAQKISLVVKATTSQ
jgi:hypothetical protein